MKRYEVLTHPEHGRRVFDHTANRWLDADRCAELLNELTTPPAACTRCADMPARDETRKDRS